MGTTQGYGYIRRTVGVDIERQGAGFRDLLADYGFRLLRPVIVDDGGAELATLLGLIESPATDAAVFVPHVRHLDGRVELVRLFAPVYSLQPWLYLERRPIPELVVSLR